MCFENVFRILIVIVDLTLLMPALLIIFLNKSIAHHNTNYGFYDELTAGNSKHLLFK